MAAFHHLKAFPQWLFRLQLNVVQSSFCGGCRCNKGPTMFARPGLFSTKMCRFGNYNANVCCSKAVALNMRIYGLPVRIGGPPPCQSLKWWLWLWLTESKICKWQWSSQVHLCLGFFSFSWVSCDVLFATGTAATVCSSSLTNVRFSRLFSNVDHVIGLEGGHSARHRLYSGKPHLQAWQRRAYARLLRGGECLSAQVSAMQCQPAQSCIHLRHTASIHSKASSWTHTCLVKQTIQHMSVRSVSSTNFAHVRGNLSTRSSCLLKAAQLCGGGNRLLVVCDCFLSLANKINRKQLKTRLCLFASSNIKMSEFLWNKSSYWCRSPETLATGYPVLKNCLLPQTNITIVYQQSEFCQPQSWCRDKTILVDNPAKNCKTSLLCKSFCHSSKHMSVWPPYSWAVYILMLRFPIIQNTLNTHHSFGLKEDNNVTFYLPLHFFCHFLFLKVLFGSYPES